MTSKATMEELRAKTDALADARELIGAQSELIDALRRQADLQDEAITELLLEITKLKAGDA